MVTRNQSGLQLEDGAGERRISEKVAVASLRASLRSVDFRNDAATATAIFDLRFAAPHHQECFYPVQPCAELLVAFAVGSNQVRLCCSLSNIATAVLDGVLGNHMTTVKAKIASLNRHTTALDLPDKIATHSNIAAASLGRTLLAYVTTTTKMGPLALPS